MGRRGLTGTIDLPRGVVQKGGSTYRRFKVKVDGKWKDHYVSLPDPLSPLFAEELAKVEGKPKVGRSGWPARSIGALIPEFKPVLFARKIKGRPMADETKRAWNYYLGLIEQEHGTKLVAELRKARVIKIRNGMAETPGKANAYVSKLRAMLEFAVDIDWIKANPADGVSKLEGGEYDPWPAEVLEACLANASPMLRLAIITGLYSGQRISDLIRMQHGWIKNGVLELSSQKTDTYTPIPMDPVWVKEIRAVPRKSVTLLYDRAGKPFVDTDRLQAQLRRLMRTLGYVDDDNLPLYSFHGLGKNACCYLTELGLTDTEISAITGKTPETVRHYAKQARKLMVALGAAEKIAAANVSRLAAKRSGE